MRDGSWMVGDDCGGGRKPSLAWVGSSAGTAAQQATEHHHRIFSAFCSCHILLLDDGLRRQ